MTHVHDRLVEVERAAAKMRSYGEWAEPIVYRIEHGLDAGSDSP